MRVTKDHYVTHSRLASFLSEKGNFNAAIYHYNKAISIKPQPLLSCAENQLARGNAYAGLLMYQLAIKDYDEAIRIKPDFVNAYFTRGTAYGKLLGQYDRALDDFNKTIQLKADHVDAYNNRGIVYTKLNMLDKAVDDFTKAILLRPDYRNAYENRAAIYLNQGNVTAGCFDAKKACELGNCAVLHSSVRNGLCRK